MRIVAGSLRGQRLTAPAGRETRPTTDRVRENLFNILQNRISWAGLRVVDLYAGSGALGLEAISRGAQFCLFVETSPRACAAIRQNAATLGVADRIAVLKRDAASLGEAGTRLPFDLAFADPPYGSNLGEQSAEVLRSGKWLSDGATFVLEEDNNHLPQALPGYETVNTKTYGGTAIGVFEVSRPVSISTAGLS